MEEERRLAYVALTRAKDKIYITHAKMRRMMERTSCNPLSRFVEEIPKHLISRSVSRNQGYYTEIPRQRTYFSASASDFGFGTKSTANTSASKPSRAPTVLQPGDRVSHMTFGEGEILSAKEMGSDVLYEVIFDRVGTKKLMGNYARLKKL